MSMCAVVLLSAVVSCERRLPDVNPGGPDSPDDSSAVTPADTLESLGTYVFGTDTCDIHVLRLEENESYVYLFISPLAPGGELSTYAVFGLRRYWCDGEEHDVNDVLNPLDHNDDYYFYQTGGSQPNLAKVKDLNIEVSIGQKRVYVKSGENIVYTMLCQTARNGYFTPTGSYSVNDYFGI